MGRKKKVVPEVKLRSIYVDLIFDDIPDNVEDEEFVSYLLEVIHENKEGVIAEVFDYGTLPDDEEELEELPSENVREGNNIIKTFGEGGVS